MKLTSHLLAAGAVFGLVLSSAPGAVLDSLQGYYTFEAQNNGIVTNAARAAGYAGFPSDSAVLYPAGAYPLTTNGSIVGSGALVGNGTNDYANIPGNPLDPQQDSTVSAWLKPDTAGTGLYGTSTRYFVFETTDPTATWAPISFGIRGTTVTNVNGQPTCDFQWYGHFADNTKPYCDVYVPASQVDQWHHVVQIYRRVSDNPYTNSMECWLDGVLRTNLLVTKTNASLANLAGFNLGTYRAANGRWFKGQIDEVALWQRALATGEVVQVYTNGLAGKSALTPFISSIAFGLVSPTNNAAGLGASPTLTVAVSNASSGNLTVTFYGRAASTPTTNADFTIVALPDTQFYTDSASGGLPAMFQAQTDWIVANRSNLNVAFVTHLGDITDHGQNSGSDSEWRVATDALYRLENQITTHLPNGIPYGVCVGNHDQTPIATGPSGDTSFFNQYFGVSHFSGFDYYGGHYGTKNNDSFQLFSAGGMDFIIIHMEYDTAASSAVLAWASNLLKLYPTRRAIVTSHWIVNTGFNTTFSAQGQAIYNTLRTNANLFLMLCGHVPGEGQRSDVYGGQTVYSILSDYQSESNGGNGWLRYYTFSPSNNLVRAFTYSPWLGQYKTDAGSRFDFPYGMDLSGNTNAGFSALATNTVSVADSIANCVWRGLISGKTYQWYVVVSDQAGNTAVSSIWSFQTQSPAAAVPRIISQSVNANGYLSFTWSSVGGTRYRVQYSDGVNGGVSGQFLDLVRSITNETDPAPAGLASTQGFTDDYTLTGGVPAQGYRFYRVKVVQ